MRKLLLATAASLSTLLAAGTAQAQSLKPVAPGTVLVHLNGFMQFGLDSIGSTYNTYTTGGVTTKASNVTTNGEVRLYPGFDGKTVDGVEYGVQIELRTAFTDAGKGVNSGTSSTSTGNLYVRRAYGYVGEKDYGYVRFGQSDGAFGLLQDGVIETFGDGSQFASSDTTLQVVPTKALPSSVSNPFIFADQGALYTADKIVLLSPAVSDPLLGGNFTGAVSYEPNGNGFKQGDANNAEALITSADLSSTNSFTSTLAKERQNTFDGAVQYALKDWGFNTKASLGVLYGNPIHYTGRSVIASGAPVAYASGYPYKLDTLQVYQFGVQTAYAGLFSPYDVLTVGANVKWGQTLDGYAPKPQGGRDAVAYIVGASYTVGSYVLGGSFFDSQSAGNYAPYSVSKTTGAVTKSTEARTLSEYGVAVGGNYIVAKDLSLYVQYLYGHSHQPGNGFAGAGAAGTPAPTPAKSNTQMQLATIGATFKW